MPFRQDLICLLAERSTNHLNLMGRKASQNIFQRVRAQMLMQMRSAAEKEVTEFLSAIRGDVCGKIAAEFGKFG